MTMKINNSEIEEVGTVKVTKEILDKLATDTKYSDVRLWTAPTTFPADVTISKSVSTFIVDDIVDPAHVIDTKVDICTKHELDVAKRALNIAATIVAKVLCPKSDYKTVAEKLAEEYLAQAEKETKDEQSK